MSPTAKPYPTFTLSASFCESLSPMAMSLVTWFPPIGRTTACLRPPSLYMATSEVPPPMSIIATPVSSSSALATAREDAKGSNTVSAASTPALRQHFSRFSTAACEDVITRTFTSILAADIPRGFRMPPCPSIMKSVGSTCSTSLSRGT